MPVAAEAEADIVAAAAVVSAAFACYYEILALGSFLSQDYPSTFDSTGARLERNEQAWTLLSQVQPCHAAAVSLECHRLATYLAVHSWWNIICIVCIVFVRVSLCLRLAFKYINKCALLFVQGFELSCQLMPDFWGFSEAAMQSKAIKNNCQ